MTTIKTPLFLFCALVILALGATPAFAAGNGCPTGSVDSSCAPGWELTSHMQPSAVAPGKRALLTLYVDDVGAANSEMGKPITVTDVLPEGVTAIRAGSVGTEVGEKPSWECTGTGTSVVRCTNNPSHLGSFFGEGLTPGFELGGLEEDYTPPIELEVAVAGVPRAAVNRATIAGGGAVDTASTSSPFDISETPAPFGVANWDVWFSNADGTLDTQAGSHPYAATFDLEVNSDVNVRKDYTEDYNNPAAPLNPQLFEPAGGELRNVAVDLPPGFVGNPTAVPQCPRERFDSPQNEAECPPDTIVGFESSYVAVGTFGAPVYNLVPPPGVAAQFGFTEIGNPVFLNSSVRTGGDDGIVTHTNNIPEGRGAKGAFITLWGVPGDPSHDPVRCTETQPGHIIPCASGASEAPLLTLPTACGAPQSVGVEVNTWQNPNLIAKKTVVLHDSNGLEPGDQTGFTGCEHLDFAPAISTAPDTTKADTPAGLTVEVKPPLGGLTDPTGLSTADIQNTTVTLPPGMVINPGQAAGLQACQSGNVEGGDDLPLPGENGEEEQFAGPAKCPGASKVGTVTIKTPLIEGGEEKQLEGNVYVLQSNPPELKLLVTASADGVNIKLIGVVHLNEQTGQLTTTFEGTPELPFSDFRLSFSGGAQAALDTPTQCGVYQTTSDFTSWSGMPGSSEDFLGDVFPTGEFAISEGPNGTACPSGVGGAPLPFSPSLTAGSTTDQAGGFTNFSLLLQRGDGQQRISGLQFKAPLGLTGELSKVPLCTNAQAETNTCPESSKIGHTVVESGPGPYPLVVPEPGQPAAPIYLTESYGGAPFGLSIVVPLHVGPFVLPTQRVRAKIEINPTTTQLTITTDPLPQIVAGVPTDLREIDAVIERPEFMVNPTNCNPSEFSGTAYGTPPPGTGGPGATAAISSPFGVGSCQSLKFEPKLTASTSGKTSKTNGASLTYKIAYPNVPQGTDADIHYVKVELPGELPSRLTTLQKACTAKVFQTNPAGCPQESVIGHALVHTQLLPVPLQGPVYFVSNGGEAFPNLEMVLQGDGVTIDLVGDTLIKNGVTSTTFKAVPDDPFTTFEITLGQGPYSALAANGNLCKPTVAKTVKKKVKVKVKGREKTVTRKVKELLSTSLTIPSDYIAQNGATDNIKVPVTVTGCAKAKPAKKKAGKKKAKGGKKK